MWKWAILSVCALTTVATSICTLWYFYFITDLICVILLLFLVHLRVCFPSSSLFPLHMTFMCPYPPFSHWASASIQTSQDPSSLFLQHLGQHNLNARTSTGRLGEHTHTESDRFLHNCCPSGWITVTPCVSGSEAAEGHLHYYREQMNGEGALCESMKDTDQAEVAVKSWWYDEANTFTGCFNTSGIIKYTHWPWTYQALMNHLWMNHIPRSTFAALS